MGKVFQISSLTFSLNSPLPSTDSPSRQQSSCSNYPTKMIDRILSTVEITLATLAGAAFLTPIAAIIYAGLR